MGVCQQNKQLFLLTVGRNQRMSVSRCHTLLVRMDWYSNTAVGRILIHLWTSTPLMDFSRHLCEQKQIVYEALAKRFSRYLGLNFSLSVVTGTPKQTLSFHINHLWEQLASLPNGLMFSFLHDLTPHRYCDLVSMLKLQAYSWDVGKLICYHSQSSKTGAP